MRDTIVFYRSFYEAIKNIPETEQLKLYNALFEYSFNGIIPDIEDGIAKGMFILMKPNIDSANARYTASVENGKRGGRPKKETQQKPNQNPEETQQKLNQNLNVDVDDNVDDNVDVDFFDICDYYKKNIDKITPVIEDKIKELIKQFNNDLIIEAIKNASIRNKKNMAYIEAILLDWKNKKYKNLDDIKKNKNKENIDFDSLYAN